MNKGFISLPYTAKRATVELIENDKSLYTRRLIYLALLIAIFSLSGIYFIDFNLILKAIFFIVHIFLVSASLIYIFDYMGLADDWRRRITNTNVAVFSFPLSFFEAEIIKDVHEDNCFLKLSKEGKKHIPEAIKESICWREPLPLSVINYFIENEDNPDAKLVFRSLNSSGLSLTKASSQGGFLRYRNGKAVIYSAISSSLSNVKQQDCFIDGERLPFDRSGHYILPSDFYTTEEKLLLSSRKIDSERSEDSNDDMILSGKNFFSKS